MKPNDRFGFNQPRRLLSGVIRGERLTPLPPLCNSLAVRRFAKGHLLHAKRWPFIVPFAVNCNAFYGKSGSSAVWLDGNKAQPGVEDAVLNECSSPTELRMSRKRENKCPRARRRNGACLGEGSRPALCERSTIFHNKKRFRDFTFRRLPCHICKQSSKLARTQRVLHILQT